MIVVSNQAYYNFDIQLELLEPTNDEHQPLLVVRC